MCQPTDAAVSTFLRTAQTYSRTGAIGERYMGSTRWTRTYSSIAVGSHSREYFHVGRGEGYSLSITLSSVSGGADADIDVYLFSYDQYTEWTAGRTATAVAQWRDQVSGARLLQSGLASGDYELVFLNTRDNYLSRTVSWTRSNTWDDNAYDALRAVYTALRARGLTYITISRSYFAGAFGQRVRLPAVALTDRSANCMDGSILFASLLEAAGIRPILIYVPGHVYMAVHSAPSGSDDLILPVETTMLGSNDFEAAFDYAINSYEADFSAGSNSNVDIAVQRARGITPIP